MSYYDNSPWDDGVYGTGRTQPPKSHGGVIAVLIITIIFLSGVVTVLGILNVRLFRQLNEQEKQDLSIAFAAEQQEVEAVETIPMETAAFLETQSVIPSETVEIQEQSDALPLQQIYERCIPSVVSITSGYYGGSSTGTGVILSEKGYVVTNYHVIEDAASVSVQLTDERVLPARIVGVDAATDLAVLSITGENLVPAHFGDSDALRVGDTVVAIGDPLGVKYRGTMTNGIVSAINRNVDINGRQMNLIQTNAALNSGNSGGPLINCYGQVVGINTMKIASFADSAGVEGLGFAIPSTLVKEIVDQLISQGYVSGRPSLGITGEGISLFYQRYYRLPSGMYVTEVRSGSAADNAGIQTGDILMAVNDTAVRSMEELTTLLYNYNAGDTVTLRIYRSGAQTNVQVVLEEARG